jgi:hypothetical protein
LQGVFLAFNGKAGMFPSAKKMTDGDENVNRMKEFRTRFKKALVECISSAFNLPFIVGSEASDSKFHLLRERYLKSSTPPENAVRPQVLPLSTRLRDGLWLSHVDTYSEQGMKLKVER